MNKFSSVKKLFNTVLSTLEDRGKTHGDVMDSWDEIAHRWSYILKHHVSRSDALLMMADMKRVRLEDNRDHEDNPIDDVGYIGLYWKSRKGK